MDITVVKHSHEMRKIPLNNQASLQGGSRGAIAPIDFENSLVAPIDFPKIWSQPWILIISY